MYELIILARLMKQPSHGYLIAKIINDIIGPYARVSNGRLYPLLAKLEQSGLIAMYIEHINVTHNDRQLRAYRITDAGEKRFHSLMMDISINPGEYQKIFWQKACYLDFLQPSERLYIIDHYLNYCQAHILHLKNEAEDFAQQAPTWKVDQGKYYIDSVLDVMTHSLAQWQLEFNWARNLREKEIKQP